MNLEDFRRFKKGMKKLDPNLNLDFFAKDQENQESIQKFIKYVFQNRSEIDQKMNERFKNLNEIQKKLIDCAKKLNIVIDDIYSNECLEKLEFSVSIFSNLKREFNSYLKLNIEYDKKEKKLHQELALLLKICYKFDYNSNRKYIHF